MDIPYNSIKVHYVIIWYNGALRSWKWRDSMSTNNYMTELASNLVLSREENSSINSSISTLSRRLDYYFNKGELHQHFQFGSSTRGTILPRRVDSESDIDYMVVFKNPHGFKPETLLRYLKSFMNAYYSRSEIYRDTPTMVLELNHVKFELVPAVQDSWGNLSIPSKSDIFNQWMSTAPLDFNSKLTKANVYNNSRIKPAVRLLKYWNTNKLNGHYYSYKLEEFVVQKFSYPAQIPLNEYVYSVIENLIPTYEDSQFFKDRLAKAKEIVQEVKSLERSGFHLAARDKIKKIFPEI